MNKFTAVFERDGDRWIGYVEELPGAKYAKCRHIRKAPTRKPKRRRGNGN